MQENLIMLEDPGKDEILDESLAASYPVHPFYILEQNSAACFFEPLLSVQKMSVIGLESVQRAMDPSDPRRLFVPQDLFRYMTREDAHLRLPLDRLFRQKSMEGFIPLQNQTPHLMLFMDVEHSALKDSVVSSGHLLRQAEGYALDPRRIVVQISLAEEMDSQPVRRFVEAQRDHGFLISLKDVNGSPEHLDTLLRFNPDLVKVGDNLVRGLASHSEKQEAFINILKMAHSLGILVTAGAIESEEDAMVALEFGADLLQGKYLSKNYKKSRVFTLNRKSRMQFLASRFKRRMTIRAQRDRDLKKRCSSALGAIIACLNPSFAGLQAEFQGLFHHFPALECLYLLNDEGFQLGDTVCSHHIPERKRILFQPSPKGTDHSLREFYTSLLSNPARDHFLSEPYLSMNSGNLCVTAAKTISDPSGNFQILCADLNARKV